MQVDLYHLKKLLYTFREETNFRFINKHNRFCMYQFIYVSIYYILIQKIKHQIE